MTGEKGLITAELAGLGFTFLANPHCGQALGVGKRDVLRGTMLHLVLYPATCGSSKTGVYRGAVHFEPDPVFYRFPQQVSREEARRFLEGLLRWKLVPHKESVLEHLVMATAKLCIDRDGHLRINGQVQPGLVESIVRLPSELLGKSVRYYSDYQEGTRQLRGLLRNTPLDRKTVFD
jgi:hypothetical protein